MSDPFVELPTTDLPDRMQWHQHARLGMSLHFGLYSIPGQGEWYRSIRKATVEQYQPFFDSFNPDRGCVREWAALAKSLGAAYCLLTAKHHDGFCLFDSKLTSYKVTNTPYARDLVRDYVDAVRDAGLKVGLYYSLVDWHHPDYAPAFGDRQHPLRHDPAARERDAQADWSKYVRYMHGQVEELLTHYGKIDVLAFDFSYWDFTGEKWGATELMRLVRRLQPDVICNDRLSNESIRLARPPAYVGDVDHVENNIPRAPVLNSAGVRVPWEAWFSVGNRWSHDPTDAPNYKSPRTLVASLVNCVSKGGNLLLNVGPNARGHLNPTIHQTFAQVGRWLEVNGESIRGCTLASLDKPEWGRFTRRGNTLYAHLLDTPIGNITLPRLRGYVDSGRLVATGGEAPVVDFWNPGVQTFDAPDDIFFNIARPTAHTHPLPDPIDTVVRFELTSPARREALIRQYADDFDQAISRTPKD